MQMMKVAEKDRHLLGRRIISNNNTFQSLTMLILVLFQSQVIAGKYIWGGFHLTIKYNDGDPQRIV